MTLLTLQLELVYEHYSNACREQIFCFLVNSAFWVELGTNKW